MANVEKKGKWWKKLARKKRMKSSDSGVASFSNGTAEKRPLSKSDDFIVVAIDFGTACSGYAYAFSQYPDVVHLMRRADCGPKERNSIFFKTPTAILLSEHEDFVAFGYEAKEIYSDMEVVDQSRYLYFEKFKMELHYTENIHRDMVLTAANGKQISAVTVFANALCYFKEQFMQEIFDQSTTGIIDYVIRWVITVPAIWTQSAKQFMRLSAMEAGLLEEDGPDELLIALEPEAASIYCQKLKRWDSLLDLEACNSPVLKRNGGLGLGLKKAREGMTRFRPSSLESSPTSSLDCNSPYSSQNSGASPVPSHKLGDHSLFVSGMRYIIVDCGGGTVDLTVHELGEKGSLSELYKATGGAWGSVGVDHQFEHLLHRIFGKDFIMDYKQHRPMGWMELMDTFESKKRSVNPLKNTVAFNISLPFSFIKFFYAQTNCTIENAVKAYHNPNIEWNSQGSLRIKAAIMYDLFHPVTEKITGHIRTLLDHPRLTNISHLFLVGGFAESPVLQHEIKKHFETRLRVVIPQDVSLTILKGAVFFGMDPTVVKIRRSALTYGVGVLNAYNPAKHPPNKCIVKGGKKWCTDIFEPYVVTDQAIPVNDVVLKSYNPAISSTTTTTITLFATDDEKTLFITDPGVMRVGELRLQMPPLSIREDGTSREIKVYMRFGDTEITVCAVDCASGHTALANLDLLCK